MNRPAPHAHSHMSDVERATLNQLIDKSSGVAELQYESLWDWNILKFEVVAQQSN